MNSRKIMLSLLVFTAAITISNAQIHSLGPTAGLNLSTISHTDNSSYLPGFNAGIIYNYSRHEHFAFGLAALYAQEGVAVDYGSIKGYTKLNYLRLPLKFQYFVGDMDDKFRPKLYIGPSLGFLLGGKTKVASETGSFVSTINRDDYNKFDAGVMGGLGFNYRLAEATWLNFDVAYTYGLLDISDSQKDSRNRNLNVNLGIAWGF